MAAEPNKTPINKAAAETPTAERVLVIMVAHPSSLKVACRHVGTILR
jgi:hypothetical protein